MDNVEELSRNIYFKKSKDYFKEVLSSYNCGNYRSAIVMLYSVVIADILYKLDDLSNNENDENARNILNTINTMRKNNPKSVEWENVLVNDLSKLGDGVFYESDLIIHIENLKKLRNLSAHPILTQDDELLSQDKETVLSNMKIMLKGLLIKPPLFMKKMIDKILNDISEKEIYDIKGKKDFDKYVVEVYLKKLNNKYLISTFRSIWKLTFLLNNDECEKNRKNNFYFLSKLYDYKKELLFSEIEEFTEYYSNINIKQPIFFYLNIFLFFYPEVYGVLNEEAKSKIIITIDQDESMGMLSYYVSSLGLKDFINTIDVSKYDVSLLEFIYSKAKEEGCRENILSKYIQKFAISSRFDSADYIFSRLIAPHIKLFSESQLKELIKNIDSEYQLYGRKQAIKDNEIIVAELKNRNIEIDYKQYKNFKFQNIDDTEENNVFNENPIDELPF